METWNQWVSFILRRPCKLTIRFLIKILCFNNSITSVRLFISFLLTTAIYSICRKGPFLSFSQGPHTTCILSCVARTSSNRMIMACDLYCCLLPYHWGILIVNRNRFQSITVIWAIAIVIDSIDQVCSGFHTLLLFWLSCCASFWREHKFDQVHKIKSIYALSPWGNQRKCNNHRFRRFRNSY